MARLLPNSLPSSSYRSVRQARYTYVVNVPTMVDLNQQLTFHDYVKGKSSCLHVKSGRIAAHLVLFGSVQEPSPGKRPYMCDERCPTYVSRAEYPNRT